MKSTKRKQICGARGKKGDGSPFRGQPVTIESAQKQAIRNLGFRGGALHSPPESSAVEPGEGMKAHATGATSLEQLC